MHRFLIEENTGATILNEELTVPLTGDIQGTEDTQWEWEPGGGADPSDDPVVIWSGWECK